MVAQSFHYFWIRSKQAEEKNIPTLGWQTVFNQNKKETELFQAKIPVVGLIFPLAGFGIIKKTNCIFLS